MTLTPRDEPLTRAEKLLFWMFSALLEDKEPLRTKAFALNLDDIIKARREDADPETAAAVRVAQSFLEELRSTRAA